MLWTTDDIVEGDSSSEDDTYEDASEPSTIPGAPATKKAKRECHFDKSWTKDINKFKRYVQVIKHAIL